MVLAIGWETIKQCGRRKCGTRHKNLQVGGLMLLQRRWFGQTQLALEREKNFIISLMVLLVGPRGR